MASQTSPAVVLTPFTCGHLTLPSCCLLDGRPGQVTVPVPAYLIEHPTGLAVFDTGVGPRFARKADEAPSDAYDQAESELIDARLRAVGVDPMRIDYILNSHLHSAHAGGNALLPAASVVVQRAEWDQARASGEDAYHAPEFDTGQPIIAITGQYDLFGDGSVVLVPTPGHTLGHQSARVQTTSGEVILVGGACHLRRSLHELQEPEHGDDLNRYRVSLQWFRARQMAGATIAFGHDPVFWATVPQSVPWNPAVPTTKELRT